jgi:uncharacterized membrane protein (UPF0127 family)
MKAFELKKSGKIIAGRCFVAKSFLARFLGLMGRKMIPADEAVFFPKCNSIHTFFMRFPIDVILLNREGQVVEIIAAMRAWRMILPRRQVRHVIEMRANRSQELGIRVGDLLDCPGVTN